LDRRQVWNGTVILCSAAFLLGLLSIAQMVDVTEPFTQAFFNRLLPVLVWVTGLSGQTVIALLILRHGQVLRSSAWSPVLFPLACLCHYLSGLVLGGQSGYAHRITTRGLESPRCSDC
jgi:hypothetical protein